VYILIEKDGDRMDASVFVDFGPALNRVCDLAVKNTLRYSRQEIIKLMREHGSVEEDDYGLWILQPRSIQMDFADSVSHALRRAEMWAAHKLIGGDPVEIAITLAHEVRRLQSELVKVSSADDAAPGNPEFAAPPPGYDMVFSEK
jgi:hypothetical protein